MPMRKHGANSGWALLDLSSVRNVAEGLAVTPSPELVALAFLLVMLGIAVDILFIEPRNRNR